MQQPAIDRLMHRYDGAVPGASLLVLRDGVALVHRGYGLSDLEHGVEAGPATNYRLASVTKQFTAARSCCWPRTASSRSTIACASGCRRCRRERRRDHAAPPADAHLGPGRLRRRDARCHHRTVARRRRAAAAGRTGAHLFHARHRLSLQQQRLFAARAGRRARVGHALPGLPARTHLPAAGHARHAGLRATAVPTVPHRAYGYSRGRRALDAHRPEPDQRRARRWRHLFVDRRPGEMGRGAVRRPPVGRRLAAHGVHAVDEDRRSGGRLRLRLAHHRRQPVAFRGNDRFPQRDRALSASNG